MPITLCKSCGKWTKLIRNKEGKLLCKFCYKNPLMEYSGFHITEYTTYKEIAEYLLDDINGLSEILYFLKEKGVHIPLSESK